MKLRSEHRGDIETLGSCFFVLFCGTAIKLRDNTSCAWLVYL